MRERCRSTKPKYKYWNGKGIKVCEEWQEYAAFRDWALGSGYGPDLCIDRINPDGNYEPI